jgi:hypothetical protein
VGRRLADVKTISASTALDRVAKLRRQKGAEDALGDPPSLNIGQQLPSQSARR